MLPRWLHRQQQQQLAVALGRCGTPGIVDVHVVVDVALKNPKRGRNTSIKRALCRALLFMQSYAYIHRNIHVQIMCNVCAGFCSTCDVYAHEKVPRERAQRVRCMHARTTIMDFRMRMSAQSIHTRICAHMLIGTQLNKLCPSSTLSPLLLKGCQR